MRALIFLSLVGGFAVTPALAQADDLVSLSQTPAAVQKAIQARVADGKMGDITKSVDDEETVYDVDLTAKDGSERDFTVAQDDTWLSTEVNLKETPTEVQKTIRNELGSGGSLDSIDENLADSDISYDVEGAGKDGQEKNFTVNDDGTLASIQVTLGDTPDPVQKTIAAQLKGGAIDHVEENFDDDGTNFDVTLASPKASFNVNAGGTLESKQVPLADVPPRAKATIENRIGDGIILRVDKSFVKQQNVFPFEVEGRKDGKPFDFSIAPRGRFLGMDN